jgi:hypothetical protein
LLGQEVSCCLKKAQAILTSCSLAYHEIRMILAKVLWNFDMELCQESLAWLNQEVHVIWEKGPLMIHLSDVRVVL